MRRIGLGRGTAVIATVGLLGMALLGGCSTAADEPAPTPAPGPTSPAKPSSTPLDPDGSAAHPGGMTIRYLGKDGKIKTLPVEDFPR
jgi:hypothetical protein